jgi:putative oxidoreductase
VIIMGMEIILSIVLGITFLASAVPKLRHPKGFILAVLEYRVLPPGLSLFYARLLPPLEFLLALLLLTGTAVRSAAFILSVLLLSFIIAVAVNMARGRDLDCHCFSKASSRPIGWRLLLQDSCLLGTTLALTILTRKWLALEPWSVFRLPGMIKLGDPLPLLVCSALTLCATALLNRSTWGRRRYENQLIRKQVSSGAGSINSERRV